MIVRLFFFNLYDQRDFNITEYQFHSLKYKLWNILFSAY